MSYSISVEFDSYSMFPTEMIYEEPNGHIQKYVPEVIEPEPVVTFKVGDNVRVIRDKFRDGVKLSMLTLGDSGKVTKVQKLTLMSKVTVDFGTHQWTLDGDLERLEHIA
jgi:transcription antitermination factor NusG